MSRIQFPALFQAVRAAILKRSSTSTAPVSRLTSGDGLIRAMGVEHLTGVLGGVVPMSVALAGITPRDGDSDSNRFTGGGPGSVRGQAGLYLARDTVALRNEVLHYGKAPGTRRIMPEAMSRPPGGVERRQRPDWNALIVKKAVLHLRTRCELRLLDLSDSSSAARAYLQQLESDGDVRAALKVTPHVSLERALLSSDDYSVARAVGLAHGQLGSLAGILAPSARQLESHQGNIGNNVVLFGMQLHPIASLEVSHVSVFAMDGQGVVREQLVAVATR